LEQEYENIINNINQSKIRDTEIVDLIKGLMDALTAGRINDQQKKRIAGQYEQQVANALYTAFGDARGGLMNVIGAVNPLGLAMAAVSSVGSSYFNYRRNLEAYRQQRESAEWEINKQILADLNNLRKSFFENSVRLTQKYNFPDEWRLSEKQLQDYIDAEKDTDPEKRFRRLTSRQNDFQVYPPFWYYLGTAAQEAKNDARALECFAKFDETNKGIFRKDPFIASVNMNRLVLLGEKATASQVQEALDAIVKNSERSDWNNFLFVALQYAKMKDYKKADELLQQNIDEGYEVSLQSRIRAELMLDNKSTDAYASLLDKMVADQVVHNQDILYLYGKTDDKRILKKLESQICGMSLSLRSHLLSDNDLVFTFPIRWFYENLRVSLRVADKEMPATKLEVDQKQENLLYSFEGVLNPANYVKEGKEQEVVCSLIHQSYPVQVVFLLQIMSETKKSGPVSKLLGSSETYVDKTVVPKLVKVVFGSKEYRVEDGHLIL